MVYKFIANTEDLGLSVNQLGWQHIKFYSAENQFGSAIFFCQLVDNPDGQAEATDWSSGNRPPCC